MLINLTYACKMGCNHCLSDCKPDGENMSISTLKDVLNFLTKYDIPTWCFSGGEIFEHPNILAMLDIIEEEWLKAGKFSALPTDVNLYVIKRSLATLKLLLKNTERNLFTYRSLMIQDFILIN